MVIMDAANETELKQTVSKQRIVFFIEIPATCCTADDVPKIAVHSG